MRGTQAQKQSRGREREFGVLPGVLQLEAMGLSEIRFGGRLGKSREPRKTNA